MKQGRPRYNTEFKIKAGVIWIFILFWLPVFSQYSWSPVIDIGNYYISTAPVLSLYSDTLSAPSKLVIGSGPNWLTNTITGNNCCYHTLYFYIDTSYFTIADCAPISPTDTARILSLSGAKDNTYNSNYMAVGGVFSAQGCSSGPPDDFRNLIFYEGGVSPAYLYSGDMDASDTVLAVATVADYDNSCLLAPELYFRTYVAARCAYCTSLNTASLDSTRYIAFYDPAKNCISNGSYNYMQEGTNGPVYALQAIDTSNVYAGGAFDSAGVIAANNIAKWNGSNWDSLGSGIDGQVKVLFWYNGNLYAGGNFTMAGGISANNIAMWNGSMWSSLGTGTNGTVNAITFHNGNLYVGGNFTQAGSSSANNIAKWDGTMWSDLLGGRNGEVNALASYLNNLYVGGNFTGGTIDTVKYFVAYRDSTVNIEELNTRTLLVNTFPNPVDDKIFFEFQNSEAKSITIVNSIGEVVTCRNSSVQSIVEIETSSLSSGLYFYRIEDGSNGYSTGKFIVDH